MIILRSIAYRLLGYWLKTDAGRHSEPLTIVRLYTPPGWDENHTAA